MSSIDLHVHSSASDGSLTPEEVVELAKESGIKEFALTDHDTVDGVERAIAHATRIGNISVIPGTELSCYYGEREIHIVGLFVDHTDQNFLHELAKLKEARENGPKLCRRWYPYHNRRIKTWQPEQRYYQSTFCQSAGR